jgi:hypothetical protein
VSAPTPDDEDLPPITDATLDETVAMWDRMLAAPEIPDDARTALCTGYIAGMTFAIAAAKHGGLNLAAEHLDARMTTWKQKGWL